MRKLPWPHHHHHRQRLPTAGLNISNCFGSKRRNYVLVLVVLVAVLILNMLLLMPQLHAPADSSIGWHLVGFRASHLAADSTAATDEPGGTVAGKTIKASSMQQGVQKRGSSSIATGEFVAAYDADSDGVLGPDEFDLLVREACRIDRASLTLLQRIRRLVRLAFGISPAGSARTGPGAEPYPCTLSGELADTTRQAVAAVTFSKGKAAADSRSASSSSSSKRRHREGSNAATKAAGAAGAATVDPDSPEGQAAARTAELLAGCSKLTPELAAAAASDGTVLLAAADWAMFELFGVNWLAHVQKAGVDNYLIAALDQRTGDFLRTNKLGHCMLWSLHAGPGAAGDGPLAKQAPTYQHGSAAHRAASWAKLQVASVLLEWGYDVVLSDLDTIWLTDPLPYLLSHVPETADLVLSTDSPANATIMASTDPGLLANPSADSSVNPAVAYIRCTAAGQAVVQAWLAEYADIELGDDSNAAIITDDDGLPSFPAAVVRSWLQQPGFAHPHPESERLLQLSYSKSFFGARRRQVAVGIFSPVAVANGYSWFVQGVGSRSAAALARSSSSAAPGRKLPLAVHMSRAGATREGRLHRIREAQWYADGPRYYSEPKLMSFNIKQLDHPALQSGAINNPDYPQSELLALHLASIKYQLGQLYAAVAAAVALGRVLVLPAFQCYCYRDPDSGQRGPAPWLTVADGADAAGNAATWSCRAPADDVSVLPFNCTLDQVMSPAHMYQHPPVFNGRPLNFREHSFMENLRTPSWVRHAATSISSGNPGGCEEGSKCAQILPGKPDGVNQQVLVPAGLTDTELVTLLQPFANAKYLHFKDITNVFGDFSNPNHRIELERWLDTMVQPWCCKQAQMPTTTSGWAMVHVKARPI